MKWEYFTVNAEKGAVDPKGFEEELNNLGFQEWELCSMGELLVFKRPICEQTVWTGSR